MQAASKSKQKQNIIIPQLIVGLGNPEPKYDNTRHNIGFAAIDALSRSWQASLSENRKFKGEYAETTVGGKKVYLLKPLTYMNLSGQSIGAVCSWYKLKPESVLVIYDDMDLPVGRVRLRLSGAAGGHNGMKSTISHLSSKNFPRLRIGIGRPKNPANSENGTVSHVLGKFTPEEKEVISSVTNYVVECVELCLKKGVEKAMNDCNRKNLNVSEEGNVET
ncbi:MAG: aminoacyl-tRNA hydrolase [Cyanobacteria bacterium J06641_2]